MILVEVYFEVIRIKPSILKLGELDYHIYSVQNLQKPYDLSAEVSFLLTNE